MGFEVPFAVFPGRGSPHFGGSSPRVVSRFAPRTNDPLIFTGGRSRAPSRFAEGVSKHATRHCERRDADRLLGRATAAKPSGRAIAGESMSNNPPRLLCALANPAMGFLGLLSGVSDAVSAARHFVLTRSPSSTRSQTAIRRSLTFRWLPSARGFFGRLMQWMCTRAHSQRLTMSIEQQRRHPCRRRPFSVFGRFAPSRSERSRSSHSRLWGRASVSERLPV